MSEAKSYLLDTSVFMDDPNIVSVLRDNHLYLHISVIDELDKNKSKPSIDPERRGNARKSLRLIRGILENYAGSPVPIPDGRGTVQVIIPDDGKEYSHADPALLDYLKAQAAQGEAMILISEDHGLLAKAGAYQLKAEYRRDKRKGKSLHEILNLPEEVDLPPSARVRLRQDGETRVSAEEVKIVSQLYHNQYVHLNGEEMLARYRREGIEHVFRRLNGDGKKFVKGIHPKNKEQQYLIDLCLDDSIRIGAVRGKSGTGKTLISLASALHLTVREKKYKQVVIVRPTEVIGRELGFLPGDLGDKFGPYIQAISDAAEVIFNNRMRRAVDKDHDSEEVEVLGLEQLIKTGVVQIIPPTFLRGRNIPNSFIIVDEAQNFPDNVIKTIATRIGTGSKVLFNGDPYQIDAPFLDQEKNGLTYLTRRFLGQDIFAAVVLKKGERSDIAELAAELL